MDIFVISETIAIASQSLNSLTLLQRQPHTLTISDRSTAVYDAIAPPPVKPKARRRTRLLKKRRTRRRLYPGEESEEYGYSGGDGGDDGVFGGGNWGGGRGWNFGGFGGQNWNEENWSSFTGGFVYEVIYWIALSNCVHFAFKKFARFFTEREKVDLRLTAVC